VLKKQNIYKPLAFDRGFYVFSGVGIRIFPRHPLSQPLFFSPLGEGENPKCLKSSLCKVGMWRSWIFYGKIKSGENKNKNAR